VTQLRMRQKLWNWMLWTPVSKESRTILGVSGVDMTIDGPLPPCIERIDCTGDIVPGNKIRITRSPRPTCFGKLWLWWLRRRFALR
jgi:hypothetical protein